MSSQTIEALVESDRFNMRVLHKGVWPLIETLPRIRPHVIAAKAKLGNNSYTRLAHAILRHVFLIELAKTPAIETTKFRVRWFHQLDGDQRFCTYDECIEIAADLLESFTSVWLTTAEHQEALTFSFEFPQLPYEIPIDYLDRPAPTDRQTRIHRRDNVAWVSTKTTLRTLQLRKYLCSPITSPDALFFKQVLEDKIRTKTYLTDRALTGAHKTNREKRWEAHPLSVQFADRRSCLAIEYVLVTQLCAFEGFPTRSREMLQQGGILPAELPTHRCPITLDPMSFPLFKNDLINPRHGRSNFQVGHLNPLKLDAEADGAAGHTASNISWISADGNRIQGSMSLLDVRALLRRVALNYEAKGWA